jgi:hypothetical protein
MIRGAGSGLWARRPAAKALARPAAPSRGAAAGSALSPDADLARAERFGHRFPPPAAGFPSPLSAAPPLAGAGVIQRARGYDYKTANYRKSSKFRFARLRRRRLAGFATKGKAGINFFTVKYKKGKKSYYLTTRSVPKTNASSFKLPAGHSEERFKHLRKKFEKRHKLQPKHLKWGATEREPCGEGAGMAHCRTTLKGMGIPDDKVFYGFPYPDREDVRKSKKEKKKELNEKASKKREKHNQAMEDDVVWLRDHHDSEAESEDDKNVVDEYESDYDEYEAPRRKRKVKKLAGSFRDGWDK